MFILEKLSNNYKNIHFQSLLGNGVMALFGMGTIVILYRALSLEDLGAYVFFMTLLAFVDAFRAGFLTTTFIKFYSGTSQLRSNQVAGSAWIIALIITLCCILVNSIFFMFSSYITNEGMNIFLKYFPFITLATLPWFMANLVVQGEKRFDRLLWMRLINQGLFTGTIIVLIMLELSTLDSIILTFILSNLVGSIATLVLGWTKISSIKHYNKNTILEIFHFGKYSMGTSLSANLFHVTDTFFVNFFLGPAALAVYNLAGKLLQIVEVPLLSFAASSMPGLSGHYNNNNRGEMMNLMMKVVGMLTILILLIAIVSNIFAEPIIMVIGGSKYLHTEAPNLFRIFMSIAVLYPAERFFSLTLDVIHKPKINFYKILIMLFVNLLGDYIGVTMFKSMYPIALANLLPMIVSIAITYYSLNRYLSFGFWQTFIIGYREILLLLKLKIVGKKAETIK
jgi:O-antigen/teichoic acid export membrane protein